MASHSKRPEVCGAVHVTLKLRRALPSLRTPRTYRHLECAIRAGKDRNGMRVIHYSVLSNHFHFFVEASNRRALSRGMQGLAIRIAKALNRQWRRRGAVFAERYFARFLESFSQVRRALRYVLQNARKHGVRIPAGQPDPFSSGRWFGHWRERASVKRPLRSPPVARSGQYLTEVSMMRGLSLDEIPGTPYLV